MRVLITGGAGLVGTPISRRFADLGWDTRVIGAEPDCNLPAIDYAKCDIRDYDSLARHFEGRDAVVHLAAIPSTRTHSNAELYEINVAGTFNVFAAAGPRRRQARRPSQLNQRHRRILGLRPAPL